MAESKDKLVTDSLGYFDVSNDDATKFCQFETTRTGYQHSFSIAFNGKVEIKYEIPESGLPERGVVKPMEWTTIYTKTGYRGRVKNKDAQKAIEQFLEENPRTRPDQIDFTVPGFDQSFTWQHKEKKWNPGSQLQMPKK